MVHKTDCVAKIIALLHALFMYRNEIVLKMKRRFIDKIQDRYTLCTEVDEKNSLTSTNLNF